MGNDLIPTAYAVLALNGLMVGILLGTLILGVNRVRKVLHTRKNRQRPLSFAFLSVVTALLVFINKCIEIGVNLYLYYVYQDYDGLNQQNLGFSLALFYLGMVLDRYYIVFSIFEESKKPLYIFRILMAIGFVLAVSSAIPLLVGAITNRPSIINIATILLSLFYFFVSTTDVVVSLKIVIVSFSHWKILIFGSGKESDISLTVRSEVTISDSEFEIRYLEEFGHEQNDENLQSEISQLDSSVYIISTQPPEPLIPGCIAPSDILAIGTAVAVQFVPSVSGYKGLYVQASSQAVALHIALGWWFLDMFRAIAEEAQQEILKETEKKTKKTNW
ncbi:hypothetical protein HK096_009406, partial [Nowakowskiella sp. JEL0078]